MAAIGGGSSLGELFVRLGLKSDDLEKGVDKSKRKLSSLRKEMREVVSQAGKVAVAAGAIGTAFVVAMVDKAGQAAREMKAFAQVANTTTREFQRNAAAARTVGVEAEKLADVYKDVSDRVGEFLQTGGGPMLDFFTNIAPRVGVTAEQFAKLSGPDALQLFVDSLEKANLSQKEATFYLEAMASDSTRLLPLLMHNGQAMKELGDQAEKTGQILSDVKLDALDRAKNSIDDFKAAMTTTAAIAASTFAPPLQAIADVLEQDLAGAFSNSEDDVVDWGRVFGDVLAFTADAVVGATKTIAAAFETVGNRVGARMAQLSALVHGEFEQMGRIELDLMLNEKQIWDELANDSNLTAFRDRLKEIREEQDKISRAAVRTNVPVPKLDVGSGVGRQPQGTRVAVTGGAGEDVLGQEADRRSKIAEAARVELDVIRDSLKTRAELEQEAFENRLKILDKNHELMLVSDQEFYQLREDLAQDYADRKKEREEAELAATRDKLRQTGVFFSQALETLTSVGARESKKQFEQHKKASIVNAIVSTYAGIARTLETYPPPVSFAMAAAQGAFGFQQVQAIRSQQFGGGGGAPAGRGGGSAAAPSGGGAQDRQVIAISGLNPQSLFEGKAVRSLIEAINAAVKDGSRVVLEP